MLFITFSCNEKQSSYITGLFISRLWLRRLCAAWRCHRSLVWRHSRDERRPTTNGVSLPATNLPRIEVRV